MVVRRQKLTVVRRQKLITARQQKLMIGKMFEKREKICIFALGNKTRN